LLCVALLPSIKKSIFYLLRTGHTFSILNTGETKIKIRILIVGIEENIIKNQCRGSPQLYFVNGSGVLLKVW
jgi:hypothetical protein